MLFKANTTTRQDWSGHTYREIAIAVLNTTAGDDNTFQITQKIQIRCYLDRNGQEFEIFNLPVNVLGVFAGAGTDLMNSIMLGTQVGSDVQTMVKGKVFKVRLPSPITVKGNDLLNIQVINSSNKDVEVEPLATVGYEVGIPKISAGFAISGNTSKTYNLGEFVDRIVFADCKHVNGDFIGLSIKSDFYKQSWNPTHLAIEIADEANINATMLLSNPDNSGHKNFIAQIGVSQTDWDDHNYRITELYNGEPLRNTTVSYDYQNGSNYKFIAWSQILMTAESLANANAKQEKHAVELSQTLKGAK